MRHDIDTVFAALRRFPSGATTKQLAAVLGCAESGLGSRLSKAFMYGKVDREVVRELNRSGRYMMWMAKSNA